ncbi:DUF2510 domain-containing protein [Nakamurella sp. PAMC28650]|uniref:DUF2510 domain-containing protein n=1 Tax=Nakamurella sp. PAMC28650 TaxID=2762325 RepID=UPI00164EB06D|nr:DUF2510 domain-containing protein [Nakamurella sp. PAMC28650]
MTTPLQEAGWYPDVSGVTRFWDGHAWTDRLAPSPTQAIAPLATIQAPYTMVTTSAKRTSHGLHLFLTIITGGIWAILVWLPITIIHRFQHEKTTTRVG